MDAEVNTLKDDIMEIRYEKVLEWSLPHFGDDNESLFEFQAARMRNYMRKQIVEDGWTPKYYTGSRVITAEYVTISPSFLPSFLPFPFPSPSYEAVTRYCSLWKVDYY
jgi:hypothetical protein